MTSFPTPTPRLTSLSHGGGCGCKIAPGVLADLLRGLCANAAAQSSLGNAAAVVAQNYTWDRNAAEMWQWLQTGKQAH